MTAPDYIDHEPDQAVAMVADNARAVQVFNPLDADPVAFGRQLAQRSENYDALALHLRNILVLDKDFGRIHVAPKTKCQKPWACTYEQNRGHWTGYTLFSPGADKVLGTLGLGVTYPDDEDYRRACLKGMALTDIVMKAYIVGGSGQVISEGMGACSRTEDKNGNLNNVLKKAAKRARLDAVMRLPSVSALFESDFLAEIAASGGGKTVNQRQRAVDPKHSTGADLLVYPMKPWKGTRFTDLEDSALDWILQKITDKPDIRAAAEKEHERRQGMATNPVGKPEVPDMGAPDLPPGPPDGVDFDDEIPF